MRAEFYGLEDYARTDFKAAARRLCAVHRRSRLGTIAAGVHLAGLGFKSCSGNEDAWPLVWNRQLFARSRRSGFACLNLLDHFIQKSGNLPRVALNPANTRQKHGQNFRHGQFFIAHVLCSPFHHVVTLFTYTGARAGSWPRANLFLLSPLGEPMPGGGGRVMASAGASASATVSSQAARRGR